MKVVTVANQKGGSGKTTTAATLAALLAGDGFRVLCIDLNEQGDLTSTLSPTDGDGGSLELLTGVSAAKLIRGTNIPGVELIAGGQELAALEGKIKTQGRGRALLLADALKETRRVYRYCIIDAPGSFNTALLNALAASDRVIIPAQPDYYSLQGIARIMKNIRYVQDEINPDLTVAGVLLTRYQGRRTLSNDVVDVLKGAEKSLGVRLFAARIRENVKLAEAAGRGGTVIQYAPGSNGAEDYRAFYREVKPIIDGRKE
jgi:chromosome partitioning protein